MTRIFESGKAPVQVQSIGPTFPIVILKQDQWDTILSEFRNLNLKIDHIIEIIDKLKVKDDGG